MFVSRKNKSITRATVNVAFRKLLELGCAVSGPKKLGTFGASYVYAVFLGSDWSGRNDRIWKSPVCRIKTEKETSKKCAV